MKIEEMQEITKQEAGALRRGAQDARDKSDKAVWEQAIALHRIRYSGYAVGEFEIQDIYVLWGFDSWQNYVGGEIGMSIGKANRMVATAHFYTVQMKGHWNKQVLSFHRMSTLAQSKKVSAKNLNSWITKARNMSTSELDDQLLDRAPPTAKRQPLPVSAAAQNMLIERLRGMALTEGFPSLDAALEFLIGMRRKGRHAA